MAAQLVAAEVGMLAWAAELVAVVSVVAPAVARAAEAELVAVAHLELDP